MTTPPKDNRYQVSDPDVIRANFEADDGWRIVCRECGKTPQDIGWCEQCGYNRPYEKVRAQPLS
jgi:rRNA maturation endonuclease Nob1